MSPGSRTSPATVAHGGPGRPRLAPTTGVPGSLGHGARVAVEWWATMVEAGERVTLPGCLLLRFAADGRCTDLYESLRHAARVRGTRRATPTRRVSGPIAASAAVAGDLPRDGRRRSTEPRSNPSGRLAGRNPA